jgi:hypothetical protein
MFDTHPFILNSALASAADGGARAFTTKTTTIKG